MDYATAFPTFQVPKDGRELNFFTYQNTFAYVNIGHWDSSTISFEGGIKGGTPFTWYNQAGETMILSPFADYMISTQGLSNTLGDAFVAGFNGNLESVPMGNPHWSIMVAGQGISSTMYDWGSYLLQSGTHKDRTREDGDVSLEYLGYWTDNGAYYYYTTEPETNYAQTIEDVSTYLKELNLPVENYQFDSWWYYKGPHGGLVLWESRPDIFPEGMRVVDQAIGAVPLILHNRYFSVENLYLQDYEFVIGDSNVALPIDEAMFTYIMGKAKNWGLAVYEQDWLVTTYQNNVATQSNFTNGARWLNAMGSAAQRLGLTVQYCMPLPLHLMQSTQIQSVTNARATTDYQPGNDQWQIGYSSLLHWAIGLRPLKDNFWSGTSETGCHYKYCYEPNPVLEALVATLSTGPVGVADKIDHINATIVNATCRADGLILKPDKPATALDKAFMQFDFSAMPRSIQVWSTFTALDEGALVWSYILAAELEDTFTVTTADLDVKGHDFVVYEYLAFVSGNNSNVGLFNDHTPLVIDAMMPSFVPEEALAMKNPLYTAIDSEEPFISDRYGDSHSVGAPPKKVDFKYYVVAPILPGGWAILGEISKYVVVSKQRFSSVVTGSDSTNQWLTVTFNGSLQEKVTVVFYTPDKVLLSKTCTIGQSSMGRIHCSGKALCTCTS
eukprot:TRINITY_DN12359_c0_g1_i1.p1 TRINITY_DN12359_c0_g1~~TRINITY_DN12359_c0_g1_i1.p1  ORF type:complete len:705 (+),score=113.09 TRINITY_DN12359_c0_g1_i1:109-2115(+)